MRFLPVLFALAVLAIGGCQSQKGKFTAVQGSGGKKASKPTSVLSPTQASPRPADTLNGKIVAVRDALRFAVIDFPNNKLPQLDQKLMVYRLDQKVAELKVSGPYRGTTVAADVLAGEPREGDLVRDR